MLWIRIRIWIQSHPKLQARSGKVGSLSEKKSFRIHNTERGGTDHFLSVVDIFKFFPKSFLKRKFSQLCSDGWLLQLGKAFWDIKCKSEQRRHKKIFLRSHKEESTKKSSWNLVKSSAFGNISWVFFCGIFKSIVHPFYKYLEHSLTAIQLFIAQSSNVLYLSFMQ